MTKSIDALKTIARYVEAKKPKTLAEAEHMLDLISVIADETVLDEEVAGSSRRPAAYAIDGNSIVSFHADSLAIAGPPSENLKLKFKIPASAADTAEVSLAPRMAFSVEGVECQPK